VIELLLFWSCCLCAIAGALGAAIVRNLFHAALLLGLSLVGVAGLYLFLEASYVACVQVVVYVGGILVLMLFATLFSSDVMGAVQRAPSWLRTIGMIGAILSAAVGIRLAQVSMQSATALAHARGHTGVPDMIGGEYCTNGLESLSMMSTSGTKYSNCSRTCERSKGSRSNSRHSFRRSEARKPCQV